MVTVFPKLTAIRITTKGDGLRLDHIDNENVGNQRQAFLTDKGQRTKDQWIVITNQLGITKIPSFVLTDKEDKQALLNNLRIHEQLKQILKKMMK